MSADKIKEAIKKSGYPFEIKIANRFIDLGFNVSPSHHFFDAERKKDLEIDMLATLNKKYTTENSNNITLTLNIAVECKDSVSPYIFFSFLDNDAPLGDVLDKDTFRFHIGTSRDKGIPNRFSVVICGDYSGKDTGIKKQLHQFNGNQRHHMATMLEKGKIHIPDKLQSTLMKLAAFILSHDSHILEINKHGIFPEDIYGTSIYVVYLVLVHTGQQYRYSIHDDSLVEANLTPVFLSYGFQNNSVNFIVDFVREDRLEDAIKLISNDAEIIMRQVYRYAKNG